MEQLCLKSLAFEHNMSSVYLGQLFKRETGKTFSRFLNELRVEHAKKLFKKTSLKANQIAIQVGYMNTDYFYNIFKKVTGEYPSEYSSRICSIEQQL